MTNNAYTQDTNGSLQPAHVKFENNKMMEDIRREFKSDSNFISEGMNKIRDLIADQLTPDTDAHHRIDEFLRQRLALEQEFKEKYANDERL